MLKSSEVKYDSSSFPHPGTTVNMKRKGGFKNRSKTLFEEYLSVDMQGGIITAEEDLKLERKLAKKLKIKDGRLCGDDDDINMLFEGIPSVIDSMEEETKYSFEFAPNNNSENISLPKKHRKSESVQKETKGGSDALAEIILGLSDPVSCEAVHINEYHERHKKSKVKLDSFDDNDSTALKKVNRKKTKFEEYLETEMKNGVGSVEADLYLEKKLARKLKVKGGKLGSDDDGINLLIEGIPSALEFFKAEDKGGNEASQGISEKSSSEKSRRMKSLKQDSEIEMAGNSNIVVPVPMVTCGVEGTLEKARSRASGSGGNKKYVAPHLRSCSKSESEELSQLRRRTRGLLNRLSESNVESITSEVFNIFQSVARGVASQIIVDEVIASCSGGPRGNEQYAAVFAAFVAGMACLVGIDFGAKLLASLAKHFEGEYLEEDNLSLRNLTLLLSYLYIFGVCSSDLLYDVMTMLSKRLTEIDVSTILTILQCCGMNLRADDPAEMKIFVLNVQRRANDLKVLSQNKLAKTSSKRMEFMLETIYDIKNNKRAKEDTPLHTQIKKWLRKLGVEDILIRGLKWSKLLDPDKKGQWWLSGGMASITDHVEEVASKIDKESLEAQKIMQLAATQRMNTDARRAIFCVIMSGEDYVDAFEKLLRLDLPGKQDREIMRVLVECCLQEKVFNKYYTVLATKLCSHDRGQKVTLQNCILDHFKELESMQLMRSKNLSKFIAEMVASFTLSLAILKRVDLSDPTSLTPKRIIHFRMLFEAIFEYPDSLVWNIFTRLAGSPDYETLRDGIEFFISNHVMGLESSLTKKFKIAKKALTNVEGVLM